MILHAKFYLNTIMLRSFCLPLILCIGLICTSNLGISQPLLSINGTVKDASSGEVLIGASMYLLENAQKIKLSNSYGFFSISATPGTYRLVALFAGYKTDTISVNLSGNQSLVIKLQPMGRELAEVVVSSRKKKRTGYSPAHGCSEIVCKRDE
ncbi:MAG: carboxypeptidase-like regulatory domain-containing protein [Sediminibacterium sp.]|nr:carboxypeptidase-like regulatory domain-containing protein [Sediminibacterium sp.]